MNAKHNVQLNKNDQKHQRNKTILKVHELSLDALLRKIKREDKRNKIDEVKTYKKGNIDNVEDRNCYRITS